LDFYKLNTKTISQQSFHSMSGNSNDAHKILLKNVINDVIYWKWICTKRLISGFIDTALKGDGPTQKGILYFII